MTATDGSGPTEVLPTQDQFFARCEADPELGLAVRYWSGGLRFECGATAIGFTVVDGSMSSEVPSPGKDVISVSGAQEQWRQLTEATPPPFGQISVLVGLGERGLQRTPTDPTLWWQYLPAVERASELLRAPGGIRDDRQPGRGSSRIDSPVGGYIHVDLDTPQGTVDHRIYYETAGQGIPLLLQHTAGAQSVQWRHLFEMREITDRFQLVAYDLPFHGKSIPPITQRWWEQEYRLKGELVRQIPLSIASALELNQPVFMGCSVGGVLALDLALHHPDVFSAVISLEGALHIGGPWESLTGLWHPQVSNQSKARMMESLCAPTSPEAFVKEVSQVYSAGWPPVFRGDLWYYMVEFDIRGRASEIDTEQVAVHILNGDYDWSGTVQAGRVAHEAIAGSTHTVMANVGHFPMQENPVAFAEYLLPVLADIANRADGLGAVVPS